MRVHISELTRACATGAEAWAAGNAKKVLVGIGCHIDSNPPGELMSWGVCGSAVNELTFAEAVEGVRVVDMNGNVLWERDPDDEPTGLREVVVHSPPDVVDHPKERKRLQDWSKAHVFDLESAKLARTGRLRRIVRVVSDLPNSPLHLAAHFAHRNGKVDAAMLGRAMKIDFIGTSFQIAKLSRVIYSLWRLSFQ